MKSVMVERFATEEVRARRRLAREEFRSGTLKNGNSSKSRVLDAKAVTQLNSIELASRIG